MSYRILDLFCGAGGCSVGYDRAGLEVICGVDHKEQPNYPYRFIQFDAMMFLKDIVEGRRWAFYEYDAIHASPPCESHSVLSHLHSDRNYPDHIAETRRLLRKLGKPYVIENVVGAPLYRPLGLCGSMFGLGTADGARYLRRHRLFETNFPIEAPGPCIHRGEAVGVYGKGSGILKKRANALHPDRIPAGGYQGTTDEREQAMGVDWMTTYELSKAIPPAYTEYIGGILIKHLDSLG